MKHESFYEFNGGLYDGVGYVKGSEYALQIIERSLLERVINWFYGIPFWWKIVIISPITCHYGDWKAFNNNWKHTRETFSSE